MTEGNHRMPRWVRVRAHSTRHEFDLAVNDARVRDGRVEVLDDYPEHTGSTALPRPAKHRTTSLSETGRPRKKKQSADISAADQQELNDG